MKVKDLRQGQTIYLVMAFPLHPRGFHANNCCIKRMLISKVEQYRKKNSTLFGSWFLRGRIERLDEFGQIRHRDAFDRTTVDKQFCDTFRIGSDNCYNSHKAFRTYKAAQRYLTRMSLQCLTPKERRVAERAVEHYEASRRALQFNFYNNYFY